MKAYVIEKLLKDVDAELPGCLRNDVPEPNPSKNQVLVEINATGLNWFDYLQLQGKYQSQPSLPFVPGYEFAGRIAANSPIPKNCPYEPGQRVLGAGQGAFAERIACDPMELIPIPDELTDNAASGIFVTYPTSYAALVFRANLQPNEWCLVHAAAGGVGMAACQIAKALGAKVIAAAGSEEKLDVARKFGGADEVVNYNEADWQKKVMKFTNGKGVDVVYDPVGRILPSLKCVAWNSRLIVVGFAGGTIEKIPANLMLLKSCSVMGVFWGSMTKKEPEKVMETWSALLDLIAEGKLKPVVYERVFQGLEGVPDGLSALANRKTWGKAVVRIRPEKQSKL